MSSIPRHNSSLFMASAGGKAPKFPARSTTSKATIKPGHWPGTGLATQWKKML
jgi:hypothetical protein